MYQNESLQATSDCYLLLEDHQLFVITIDEYAKNGGPGEV